MPDQPTTDGPPVATTPPADATPPAATTSPAAAEPVRPSRAPLVISILALTVAACAAALAIWQIVLTRQNDVRSQRASVHVSNPQAALVPDPHDRAAMALAVTAMFTNSGNRPTKNLTFFMRCATAHEPTAEPWTLLFQAKIEKQPLTLGPHASSQAQCMFGASQLRQMTEGKLTGYVLGDVAYHDRLDDRTLRRTQFAWQLSNVRLDPANNTVALTALPQGQHNCADEECPLAIMTH